MVRGSSHQARYAVSYPAYGIRHNAPGTLYLAYGTASWTQACGRQRYAAQDQRSMQPARVLRVLDAAAFDFIAVYVLVPDLCPIVRCTNAPPRP